MKKIKNTFSIILSVIAITISYSLPAYNGIFEGDVTLTSQAEVDAFSYTEVTGHLTISGNDISNLDGLSALTRVKGLTISGNASLTNVDGLSALSQAGSSINISDNPVLANLDGLSSVAGAPGLRITIHNNAMLESINGFSMVAGTLVTLRISANPQLRSIEGFRGVTFFGSYDGGELIIDNNSALTNVDGLSSISSFGGKSNYIQITNNNALLDIDGLASLHRLGGTVAELTISNNQALRNLNGLASLAYIGTDEMGSLIIQNNASLEDLDGLANLRHGLPRASSKVIVTNNASLSRCSGVLPLLLSLGTDAVAELANLGNIDISENGAGCTLEEILAAPHQLIHVFSIVNELSGDRIIYEFDDITIDLSNPLYANSAVQALTFPSAVGSVVFKIDSQSEIVDNEFPYTLSLTTLGAGTHHVTAAAYAGPDKQGEKGFDKSFDVNILGIPQICQGNITLVSQAQVDAFTCTEVTGNLMISGTDITSLQGLSTLTKVGNEFYIENNPNLESLAGLNGLESVTGNLRIGSNQVLSNIDALNSLKTAGGVSIFSSPAILEIGLSSFQSLENVGQLYVNDNENLLSVGGFNKVTVAGPIGIDNNPKLVSIIGFNLLTETKKVPFNGPGTISISKNDALINLDCFRALVSVGRITISMNNKLATLDGFSSVAELFGALDISSNALLKSVNGFQNLTRMSSISREVTDVGIIISNNPSLESLSGLSSVERIYSQYRGQFEIFNNGSLQNMNGFSSLKTVVGESTLSFQIRNNAKLEDIDGLSALSEVGGYLNDLHFAITQNPLLTQCCVLSPLLAWMDGIFHLDTMIAGGHLLIAGNGGCTVDDIIACGAQRISQLQVINLRTGHTYSFYRDSVMLDLADPDFSHLAIQARTLPATAGSVEFRIGQSRHTENNPPYIFDLPMLGSGAYQLDTDVYSQSNKQGVKGLGKTAKIVVRNSTAVVYYDLVDGSGTRLRRLRNGDKINIKDVIFSKSINIEAIVSHGHVASVRFFLNGVFVRREMSAPFAFNGNNDDGYYPWKPQPGVYTIKAVPYVVHDNKEYEGEPLEISFTVEAVESPIAVVGFDVVDLSGNFLTHLYDGDLINIKDPAFKAFNIVAQTTGPVGSVNFWLNNKSYRTENGVPYTLAGDQNGKFNTWSPQVGDYKLSAIPHSERNAKGTTGNSLTIQIKIVADKVGAVTRLVTDVPLEENFQDATDDGLTLYPVPVDGALFVKMKGEPGRNTVLTIVNVHGLTVYKGWYAASQSIDTQLFKSGVYFLQISDDDGFRRVIKFIKQ